MRGTGQPLCSLRRELPPAFCTWTCCSRALWLLLQLNSLLRVPYVRMHFRPSDQASWVVASHKARFSGPGLPRTWLWRSLPNSCSRGRRSTLQSAPINITPREKAASLQDPLLTAGEVVQYYSLNSEFGAIERISGM